MKTWVTLIICIAVIAAVMGLIVYAYREKISSDFFNDEKVKKAIKSLILAAEKYLDSRTGQEKLAWVVERVTQMLPGYIRIYITDKMIIKVINIIFDQIAVVIDGHRVPMP